MATSSWADLTPSHLVLSVLGQTIVYNRLWFGHTSANYTPLGCGCKAEISRLLLIQLWTDQTSQNAVPRFPKPVRPQKMDITNNENPLTNRHSWLSSLFGYLSAQSLKPLNNFLAARIVGFNTISLVKNQVKTPPT